MQQLIDELYVTLGRMSELTEQATQLLVRLRGSAEPADPGNNDPAALERLASEMGSRDTALAIAETYLLGLSGRVEALIMAFGSGDESGGMGLARDLAAGSAMVGAQDLHRCARDIVANRVVPVERLRSAAVDTRRWLKAQLAPPLIGTPLGTPQA